MFRFDRPQSIFQIGKVRIGGQPGELPTVLVGSIFHSGHRIVEDPNKGIFDKKKAEALVNRQDELSDKYGLPCMIDVVGTSPEAWVKYAEFLSGITDAPLFLDGVIVVRLKALKGIEELGLSDRIVYDSIWFENKEEVTTMREAKVKAAILLAFNVKDHSAKGCLDFVKGDEKRKGLLTVAKEAGIEKCLVDTSGTNIPRIGIAARAAFLVKQELGLPAGFSPENAAGPLKKMFAGDMEAYTACWSSAQTFPLALCADFILYGPIEKAKLIFPACSVVNSMMVAAAKDLGTDTLAEEHPIRKLFPDLAEKLGIGAPKSSHL